MRSLKYLTLSLFLLIAIPVTAQTNNLSVTTIERNPFVKADGDQLSGFSIELWQAIAKDNGWEYDYTVVDSFKDLLRPVRQAQTDLAIANISITADREEVMDFSSSIFHSGLQIMIPTTDESGRLFYSLVNPVALTIFGILFAGLLIASHILWFAERKRDPEITIAYIRGIWDAIWWTVTLGGFGKNLPTTILGRLTLLSWMIVFTGAISLYTANTASTFTTNALGDQIKTVQDLNGKRVGTTEGSTSETFLRDKDIKTIPYNSIDQLFNDLSNKKIDAIVHDTPLLQYYAANDGKGKVMVSGEIFNAEQYGIALPSDSPLREKINESLLRLRENGTYDQIYNTWFSK